MRTNVRKIGNSKGVIIPAALLAACELGDEVELTVRGKSLVIEALRAPRKGWFDGCQPVAPDVDAWAESPVDEGDDEWVW
jgi:antitoxin MazE